MKKGFVLTLDAMVALILAAIFFSTIMYLTTAPKQKNDEYLFAAAQDILTVSDKDGSLTKAASGDILAVDEYIKTMPDNLCVSLTIANSTGETLFTDGNGCPEPTKYIIARRTVTNGTDRHIAKARVWYK